MLVTQWIVSSISWLSRHAEQFAPAIDQPLPMAREFTYRVGGNWVIQDGSASPFNPHWWLFELGTAKWRKGYDTEQRPVYNITLRQDQVFHVLLVDYWKPPIEEWRQDQYVPYVPETVDPQDATPATPSFTDDSSGYVPTFTEG